MKLTSTGAYETAPSAPPAAPPASPPAQTPAAPSAGEFRELMTIMLLGMSMSMMGGGGGSDPSGGMGGMGGMSMNAMMAPLMLTLMEKMLAGQVETAPAGQSAAPAAKTQDPAAAYPLGEPAAPSGRPIKGVLTQASHPGHVALDFGAPVGTPVKATMDGKVVYAGWNDEGYGNLVIVEHGRYRTYYAHLSKLPVKVGETVRAGETIALSGNTGNSTGPHLHYEVRISGRQVDPAGFMKAA